MALDADKLYYSISELAQHFDVAPSLLRYWESEFNTIKPKRNTKGTRFYSHKDVKEIERIHLLVKQQGHTLKGAKSKLKEKKSKVDSSLDVVEKLENIKEFLTKLKGQL
jgi:DNA-binding transcriptional MerR regulator